MTPPNHVFEESYHMTKKPSQTTTKRAAKKIAANAKAKLAAPVASGVIPASRSPIIPARAVSLAEAVGDVDLRYNAVDDIMVAVPAKKARANLAPVQLPPVPLSDSVARARARDRVEVPVNPQLELMVADLADARAKGAVSNWEAMMIDTLIDMRDLQDVIDAMTARSNELREQVKLGIANSEQKTFKCALGSVTLAKGAETVSIVDAKLVPASFLKTEIDKAKVSRALKVPTEVPGATLVTGAPSLRISWGGDE